MSASPSISVVVPTYNRAESVVRAVRSVLVQTFADLEVVVVDDGSTDATQAALAALDDPRLRYLSQANAGPSVARNTGAAAARSDAVIFLDSDDVAMPGWIGAHVEARTGDPVRLSRSGYLDLDAAGRLRSVVFARALTGAGHTQGTFIPGTFAIEKRLFEEVGGYEPALRFGENTELAVRVLRSWRAGQWRSTEIPRLLVRRQWSDRAAKYDDLKATTARFELEHHADVLRTHRESWSVRQSIVGVADARAGDLASARRAFLSAWRATPSDPASRRAPSRPRCLPSHGGCGAAAVRDRATLPSPTPTPGPTHTVPATPTPATTTAPVGLSPERRPGLPTAGPGRSSTRGRPGRRERRRGRGSRVSRRTQRAATSYWVPGLPRGPASRPPWATAGRCRPSARSAPSARRSPGCSVASGQTSRR
ncbi:MAG: glycosyltransferase family 2 protein [Acidimicrobiia bacterium]|nr:glycosyltransferase family 2 protein [Acidimicrobiia bacterium]